ncbi:serine/threonine-protein kinase [Myceligenerans crystallogenes]|uniref:Protein kinase domain-containing protein n=1 Tax=Myceligenerans crystallogenes TaxID=316335 RepID=A0ABP4ZLU4_9MICO
MGAEGGAGSADVIGGYRLTSKIGSGAMGTVYRALDDGGSAVALKLLAGTDDDAARERLRREASALQRLRHPGVARVLDVELDAFEAFIVTELVEGPTLEEEVDTRGPLDPRDLYELADQLGDALEAVHEAGVVHRDLTPSNVLVSPKGPVLIDFGLAQGPGDARATRTGFVMGTPGYLAPELLDGGEPAPYTDWWSWSAVLAFAATGRSPFGVRPLELVLQRSREGRADLSDLEPRVARALEAALRPVPAERWGPTEVGRSLKVASEAFLAAGRGAPGAGAGDDGGFGAAPAGPTAVVDVVRPAGGRPADVTDSLPAAGDRTLVTPRPDRIDEGAAGAVGAGAGAAAAGGGGHGRSVRSHPVGAVSSPGAAQGAARPEGTTPDARAGAGAGPGRTSWPLRTGTLAAVAGALAATAATRPGWALAAFVVLCVICRTSGALADSVENWRMRHGTAMGGRSRAAARLPWFLVRSVFGVLPAVLIAAAAGAIVALGGLWLFAPGRLVVLPLDDLASRSVGGVNAPIVDTWVLALAMVVTMLLAWWGPVSGPTRRGAGALLATVAPGRVGAGVVVVLAMAVVGLSAAAIVAEPLVIDWWPLEARPEIR